MRRGALPGLALGLGLPWLIAAPACAPASGVDGDFVCDGELAFADPALERELQLALGWDPEGEEEPPTLTYTGLLELRTLDASNAEITSLGGLQCVQGIEQLTVAGNDIEDLGPLGALRGLTQIDVSRNPLRGLGPLADTRRLERLVARGANVDDLSPLAGATRLRHLDVTDNAVDSTTPLAELRELETLLLSRNEIRDVSSLAELPGLVSLSLDRNEVTDIEPLGGLVNLYYLDLDQNQIEDLRPLEGMFSLIFVRVSANPVAQWPRFDQASLIEDFRARETGLDDLGLLSPLTRLRYLDAGDNEIRSLEPLRPLPALRQLFLTNNDIASLEPLSGATVLRNIDVRGNDAIVDLGPLSGAATLDTVRVGASEATPAGARPAFDLTPLADKDALGRLVLQFAGADIDLSPVVTLPFLSNVGVLDTPLDDVDLALIAGLPNLRLLELTRVGIDDLAPLATATNIQSLRLQGNAITDISMVEQWPLLTELVLRDNPDLVDVQVIGLLGSLGYLDLRGTAVADVGALLDNQAFRDGDRLDVRETSLDDGDCGVIEQLRDRGVDVFTDLDC